MIAVSDRNAAPNPSPLGINAAALAVAILGALTLIRLVGLWFSQVDLFYDEAQYWAWSRELAFGYFSKPPLIAWEIALTNALCGTSEVCVRGSLPLFYFGLSLLVYAVASELYDRRSALWASVAMALVPAVCFSSRVLSTDVLLLFFWGAALWAYVKLLRTGAWRWAFALGAALGFGLLAKYAMLYFLLAIAAAALVDVDARTLIRKPQLWLAVALGLLMVLPNLFWNLAHGFVTLKQTGDNIQNNWLSLSPRQTLEFVGSQFAIFGPLVFGAFIVLLATIRRPDITQADRLLTVFALAPLLPIVLLSIVKPMNANWAAPAGIAIVIVAVAVMLRRGYRSLVIASLAIGLLVQALLLVGDIIPYRLGIAARGAEADVYHRTLGWRALAEQTGGLAQRTGAATILSEGRYEMASLIYYLRDQPRPVLSWPGREIPDHQFDMTDAVKDKVAEPALFVTGCIFDVRLKRYFGSVQRLGPFDVASGPYSSRRYYAYLLRQQSRPIGPLDVCWSGVN